MGILFSVGFLEMVPAVSNRGVCFFNTDSINRGRELVKMCDFNWYRAIC